MAIGDNDWDNWTRLKANGEEMAASLPEVELVKSILQGSVRTTRKKRKEDKPYQGGRDRLRKQTVTSHFRHLAKGQPYQT
ncbi:hypothetical protein [Paenibacillus sp. OK076]|uniref:hypothetical protein n=2 Tax=unclassified Paenibacillus TaxID=185978 RepID=UPI00115FBB2C|nr:hypothetical protein [Paenibacillus sp. OK076]